MMRWRFRPSTEPPRWQQVLLATVTPPDERRVVLSDLQDEYEERVLAEGTASARRIYRRQVLGSLGPGLRWRLERLGSRRRGSPVAAGWRPAPEIPTDIHNRGETMSDVWNDFKFGFRSLSMSPLVFTATVVSLAIGIAATTTVFSMANAFLFRPPAVDLPDNVVAVFTSEEDGVARGDTSYPDYLDAKEGTDAIEQAFLHRLGIVDLEDDAGAKRVLAELVTGDYFELMGLDMTLGRGFTAEETRVGSAQHLVVLSHDLWNQRFAADPEILGRAVRLDRQPYTVVGVGPKGYLSRFIGLRIDAWMPIGVPARGRGDRNYRMMARLAPGTSLAAARSQLETVAERLRAEHSGTWTYLSGQSRRFIVTTEEEALLSKDMAMGLSGVFGLLLVAAGGMLLIACCNVVSLFLARAHQRRREMALRLAIGAGRWRLIRLLMAESLVPALAAGVLGSLFAAWAVRMFGSLPLRPGILLNFDFHLDHRVLLFTLAVSLVTSVVFGLLPALEGASPNLVTSLKADVGTGDQQPSRFGLRRVLVVAQVAVALVFVVGAGLTLRALGQATTVDMSLDIGKNAVMSRNLPEDQFSLEAGRRHLEEAVERLRQRPEVAAAHLATSAEMSFLTSSNLAEVLVDGHQRTGDESNVFSYNATTPGYLEMMGVHLLKGRTLNDGDLPGAPPTAVVTEAFAHRFWPGEAALGQRFRIRLIDGEASADDQGQQFLEIVGIVADRRYNGLVSAEEPYFWTSLDQQGWSRSAIIHVRGRTSADEALAALREEIELAQGESALIEPMVYDDLLATDLFGPRLLARVIGWAGIFGVVLAIFGIYGIVSFTAALRNREMAVRQAMGASPGQIVQTVVWDGFRLALWGIAIGLMTVVSMAYAARSLLFGISPLDPAAVGGSAAALVLAALVASWVPAQCLASCDPMAVLRDE